MITRPHEVGLVDFWRADSQSLSKARSRNYPMCENAGSSGTARMIFFESIEKWTRLPNSHHLKRQSRRISFYRFFASRRFTQPRP